MHYHKDKLWQRLCASSPAQARQASYDLRPSSGNKKQSNKSEQTWPTPATLRNEQQHL